jgi:hypothetical protein
VAVVAIPLGLLWVSGTDPDASAIAIGAAQILYGILVFFILILNGAEFSRLRECAKLPQNSFAKGGSL